jgi:hypothetical protein
MTAMPVTLRSHVPQFYRMSRRRNLSRGRANEFDAFSGNLNQKKGSLFLSGYSRTRNYYPSLEE